MSVTSYGQITLVDLTDIGQFSITPNCNQPLTVLYDPDTVAYTPNWASNNLVITPIMYYGSTRVSEADGAIVTWRRKINSGQSSPLISGETVSHNILTVSAQNLTVSTGPTLTYICAATYTEPNTNVQLTAEGQISFTLVQNASTNIALQIGPGATGNIIVNGGNNVELIARLSYGSTDVTSSAGIAWYQYDGTGTDGYGSALPGQTSSTLTVTPSMVSSYASFKCAALYPNSASGTTYEAYYSVMDKTDPLQIYVMSSIGDQIKNRVGAGAIYVKVVQNGIELDPLRGNAYFGETAPESPTTGMFWYFIDTTNRTVTLLRYSNGSWNSATGDDLHEDSNYTWTFRDADGSIIQTYNGPNASGNYPTHGKVIYIDGEMIDGKVIADVTAEF